MLTLLGIRRVWVGLLTVASVLVLVFVASVMLAFAGVGAAAVLRGGRHSLLAWGWNSFGELGRTATGPQSCDGWGACSRRPVRVVLPEDAKLVAVAAGEDHSLALTRTGQVLAWGDNTTNNSHHPVKVKLQTGTKAVAVAAGFADSLALLSTGQVLSWGFNADGELGDGTFTGPETCRRGQGCSTMPVKVQLPTHTKAVAVTAGTDHNLALTSTGQVLAWGSDADGQLGDGEPASSEKCIFDERCSTTPVEVQLPTGINVAAVSAGDRYSLALTSVGRVLAWGINRQGQLGNGSRTKSDHPVRVKVPKGEEATAVASGPVADHSLALARPR